MLLTNILLVSWIMIFRPSQYLYSIYKKKDKKNNEI